MKYSKLRILRERTRQTLLNLGVSKGHRDYTRFVIVSCGRSGTSLLRSLLKNHPNIHIYGELFRKYGEINWQLPGYATTPAQIRLAIEDPTQFIEEHVYKTLPVSVKAVGFKLFYNHASKDGWEKIWNYLDENKDIKIIHLKRENKLKTFLSLQKAFHTGQWGSIKNTKFDDNSLALDYEACKNYFLANERWVSQTQKRFSPERRLELTYEGLAQERERILGTVYSYLNVPKESTFSRLRKQSSESLKNSISNYAELKEQFSNSHWEKFFVE